MVCLYDPPGNVFGSYSANVQPAPGAAGPLPEDIPPFLVAAFQQNKGGAGIGGSAGGRGQQEGPGSQGEGVAAAVVADSELAVAGPDTPRSFASASRVRAGELSEPLRAPNLLLNAPTPALNFLAEPYELPRFQVTDAERLCRARAQCLCWFLLLWNRVKYHDLFFLLDSQATF